MLLVEIILIIEAWRRGWKGWALLPLGVGAGIGFLIGLIMGASGVSEDSIFGICFVVDLACIGVLIGMIAKPRRVAKLSGTASQPLQNDESSLPRY